MLHDNLFTVLTKIRAWVQDPRSRQNQDNRQKSTSSKKANKNGFHCPQDTAGGLRATLCQVPQEHTVVAKDKALAVNEPVATQEGK